MSDFVCGANEDDFHFTGVNWGRDLPEPDLVADIRNVVAGDPSPDGKGALAIERGIEVGHVFLLGTQVQRRRWAPPSSTRSGKPQPLQMGCYGIGVTRIVGAAIEQNHDERGIIWPDGDGALRGRRLPDRLRPVGRRARGRGRAPRGARGARHRRDARRPRRAPRRDVRRLGADRHAAPRRAVRARPQGRRASSTRAGATPSRRHCRAPMSRPS